ncbi:MAG: hypothetical protein EA404_15940 [Spirochaetaceae bacterium]|nr:MAG: hypothetical protein EA404_15940 [Spirochaetaceae bacterium]
MPRLEDIEKFSKSLLSLGSEPSVLARWGEELETEVAADDGSSPELESLLQEFPQDSDQAPPDADDLDFDIAEDFPTDDSADLADITADDSDDGSADEFLQDFAASMEDSEAPADESAAEPSEPPQADFDDVDSFDLPEDFDSFDFADLGADAEDTEDAEDAESDFADTLDTLDAEPAEPAEPAELDEPAEPAELGEMDEAAEPAEPAEPGADLAFDPGEFEIDDEVDEISLDAEEFDVADVPADEDDFAGADFDSSGFEGADFEAADEEFGAEGADDLLEVDEFSLGDFGAEFGVAEEEPAEADEDDLNPALAISDAPPESIDASGPDVELSDEEFAALQRSLAGLPLNVKMAAEEIIGDNNASSGEIEKLVRQLVRGEAPKAIAATAGRILGKQLRLPKGYEKRTGSDYEAERSSIGYQLRHYVWPVLRLVASVALIVALLGFLGYNYLWQPLHARGIYLSGLEHLAEERYAVANERFAQAETFWRARRWFYRYAEAFVDQRQYGLAVQKYDQLLQHWPQDERGILDYARLESQILGNYARAEELLQRLLDEDIHHYDALLAAGDNYMEWALSEPERYEDARASYARLIGRYGDSDELLMRMLHYFIRTDDWAEVQHLKRVFEADQRAEIDPLIYAELGGYLLDNNQPADVFDILMRSNARAEELDQLVPEVHYHFARYYRMVDNPIDEARALRNSRLFLESVEPLNRRRLGMLVDTYGRLAHYHYERDEFIDAEELYRSAIRRYEDARARNLLQPAPQFGRVYAGLGNIHYYVERNWEQALERYQQAETNGYRSREMSYRQGFVHYRAQRWEQALDQFFNAAEGHTTNPPLLLATANALYHSGSLYPAEGYYAELLDEKYRRRARIDTLLLDEEPEHRALIEYLIRGQNNLGVAYLGIARRETSPEMRRRAMEHLQASQELAVNYRRDPQTGARAETVNLSYLNLRDILYPLDEFDAQIYNAIPEDFSDLDF